MMIESSTKQYPTNLRESWEIQHLKTPPLTASRRQLSRVVLNIAHISGAAPFPCTRPWGGGGGSGAGPICPLHI